MLIAHLTDLHLRANLPGTSVLGRRRCREAPQLLTRGLEDARARGADLVVLTGDLVDVPSFLLTDTAAASVDTAPWRAALKADYRLIRDLLAASGLPNIVLPGNHDDYELVAEIFGAAPFVRQFDGVQFVSFWDREDKDNVPRRVEHERNLFNHMLAQRHTTQVHLQHFVITPELNQDWPHTYAEGERLRQEIVASGQVRLVLSGHYHPGTDLIQHGGAAFASGSALCEAPHSYRLYDIKTAADDRTADVTMTIVPLMRERPELPGVFLDYTSCLGPLPTQWADVDGTRLLDDVVPPLRELARAGYSLIGFIDRRWLAHVGPSAHLRDVTLDRYAQLLAEQGVVLDAVYPVAGSASGRGADRMTVTEYVRNNSAAISQACTDLALDVSESYVLARVESAGTDELVNEVALVALQPEPQGSGKQTRVQTFTDLSWASARILAGR